MKEVLPFANHPNEAIPHQMREPMSGFSAQLQEGPNLKDVFNAPSGKNEKIEAKNRERDSLKKEQEGFIQERKNLSWFQWGKKSQLSGKEKEVQAKIATLDKQADKAAAMAIEKKAGTEKGLVNHLEGLPVLNQPKSLKTAVEQAQRGKGYIQDILSDKPPQLEGKAHLQAIADIQWALYEKAVAKGDGFISGNMLLEDPQGKIFNFMRSYQEKEKPSPKVSFMGRISELFLGKPMENNYKRWSSHFKAQRADGENYGIDMPDDIQLPAHKKTILYGQLKNADGKADRFFAKWEYHGYNTPSDKWGHMLDFLSTRFKKGEGKKEHVPKDIKQEFNSIVRKEKITLTPSDKENIKDYGIQAYLKILSDKNLGAATEFNSFLTKKGLDHLQWRTGNEVVLKQDELLKT